MLALLQRGMSTHPQSHPSDVGSARLSRCELRPLRHSDTPKLMKHYDVSQEVSDIFEGGEGPLLGSQASSKWQSMQDLTQKFVLRRHVIGAVILLVYMACSIGFFSWSQGWGMVCASACACARAWWLCVVCACMRTCVRATARVCTIVGMGSAWCHFLTGPPEPQAGLLLTTRHPSGGGGPGVLHHPPTPP